MASPKEKARANNLLKFSVALLQGKHGWKLAANRKYRILVAEDIAGRLADAGLWWQARNLWSWIHRCRRGDFDVEVNIKLVFTPAQQVTSLKRERRASY